MDMSSDLDSLTSQFNHLLSGVLDKHAPLRRVTVKGDLQKAWYDDNIHQARRKRRQLERKFLKTRLEVDRLILQDHSISVVHMINRAKVSYFRDKLMGADSKETFKVLNGLLSTDQGAALPSGKKEQELADSFASFFHEKVTKIRVALDSMDIEAGYQEELPPTPPIFSQLADQSMDCLCNIINKFASKTCSLDAIPTALLKEPEILRVVLPTITSIVNQSLASYQQC